MYVAWDGYIPVKIVHVWQKLHDKIAVILGRKIAFHIEGK